MTASGSRIDAHPANSADSAVAAALTVVVLAHDRPWELMEVMKQLARSPERPAVIVVDNASAEPVAPMLASMHGVEVVRLHHNAGAAGRNAGVERVRTRYVAFSDDDTWWEPGALCKAVRLLDAHPGVTVVAARVLIAPCGSIDPTCIRMARSPLRADGLPWPVLIGFMAGACVMRTDTFRAAGGYDPALFLGAEEFLLSLDVMAAGGRIVYADDIVLHHHPSARARDPRGRSILESSNRILIAWMRLPLRDALQMTAAMLRHARAQRVAVPVLLRAAAGLPRALVRRHAVPTSVSDSLRTVSACERMASARIRAHRER